MNAASGEKLKAEIISAIGKINKTEVKNDMEVIINSSMKRTLTAILDRIYQLEELEELEKKERKCNHG